MQLDTRGRPVGETQPEQLSVATSADRGGVIARCSLARGRSLSPGIQKGPFYWRDVVSGPPPRRREKGDCIHVTWHGADDSGDVRLSFTTLVRVDPGLDLDSVADDVIHVEERLYLQRRLLQEFIDRERAFTDRIALRMRARLAHNMVQQRRRVNRIQTAWVATLMLRWIRLQAKTGNMGIRGFRRLMRGLVALPDAILTYTERASIHLASRSGRRWLRKAIRDPNSATPQEKAGVLVWLTVAVVGVVLLASLLFATVLVRFDAAFSHIIGDFTGALLGTIAIPLPAEILFINSITKLGYALGPVGLFAGKMLGAWMLYLLGDSLFDTLNKKSGPRMKGAITWLQRNANEWGFLFLLLLNAIPLAPDALIVVFAVSGMRFRSFMVSIAVGSLLKMVLLGTLVYFIGPEAVRGFIEHPIQTMRGA